MQRGDLLRGKKVLVVDDEPDILESAEEVLEICDVDTAEDFSSAKTLLEDRDYDLVVLDIMGVNGYELLKIAKDRGFLTVMLTGHALSADNFARSMDEGADAYLPKTKLAEIDTFLEDVLSDDRARTGRMGKWFSRLKSYYENKFGPGWLEEYKGAWH